MPDPKKQKQYHRQHGAKQNKACFEQERERHCFPCIFSNSSIYTPSITSSCACVCVLVTLSIFLVLFYSFIPSSKNYFAGVRDTFLNVKPPSISTPAAPSFQKHSLLNHQLRHIYTTTTTKSKSLSSLLLLFNYQIIHELLLVSISHCNAPQTRRSSCPIRAQWRHCHFVGQIDQSEPTAPDRYLYAVGRVGTGTFVCFFSYFYVPPFLPLLEKICCCCCVLCCCCVGVLLLLLFGGL
jgi:hypothetical protein